MTDSPITVFAVHTPTATPSDICSYYAEEALSHSVWCVVLFFFVFGGPSPHVGTTLETTLSPLSFGKSFMKIRSAVPENGCLWRTEKKQKKNICKTYTHLPHRRLHTLTVFSTIVKCIPVYDLSTFSLDCKRHVIIKVLFMVSFGGTLLSHIEHIKLTGEKTANCIHVFHQIHSHNSILSCIHQHLP